MWQQQQLDVQQNTERPPVNSFTVPLVQDDFRGEVPEPPALLHKTSCNPSHIWALAVLGCATQRPRPRRRLHVLRKSKVAQLEVARLVEQKVFGLEVAVHVHKLLQKGSEGGHVQIVTKRQ